MFKNLTVFEITPDWSIPLAQAEAAAQSFAFIPCGPTQPKSIGFTAPRDVEHAALVESMSGHWILRVTTERRILPASVVQKHVQERVDQIHQQTGRTPGKKERSQIKDDVVQELLPKCFTKQDHGFVWLDTRSRLLFVDFASKAKCDDVLTLLSLTFSKFLVRPYQTQTSPATSMTTWLHDAEPPQKFTIDDECELTTADESKSTVKYRHHDLDISQVRSHLEEGKVPVRLAMTWNDRVSFLLTETMQLKKLHFHKLVFTDERYVGTDAFDTNMAIGTGELAVLLPDLIRALGGPVKDLFSDESSPDEQRGSAERALEDHVA